MRLRNGAHGYGAVTKALHWLTVLTIAAQFAVGYTMATDGEAGEGWCDAVGNRTGNDADEAVAAA